MTERGKKTMGKKLNKGRLDQLLTERAMTQKQLSEVSGVPASSLSEYMSGKCAPRANALQRLADALQTTPEDLCSPAKRSRWRISVKIERNCRPKRPDADGTHPRHTVGLDIAAQRRNTRY